MMKNFNNVSLQKRNTSYVRPLAYHSGKSSIPTITIKAKNPLKLEKVQKINNIMEGRDIKDINENIYKEKINVNKENLSKTLNNTNFVNEYLNLVRCSKPYCTCANCIQNNNKNIHKLPTYSYQSNIKSNYQNEYNWKQQEKAQSFQKAKLSHFDKAFKEYIKPGLESVMHKDYKNTNDNMKNFLNNKDTNEINLTEISENSRNQRGSLKNRDNNIQMSIPFLGRSSYDTQFPQWNNSIAYKKIKLEKNYQGNEVPFSGKSSYMETYGSIEDKYYREKTNPILKKDNLEVGSGNFLTYTSTGNTYRPVDYKMARDLNNMKSNFVNEPANLRTAPFSKDSFLSSYEKAFMGNRLFTK